MTVLTARRAIVAGSALTVVAPIASVVLTLFPGGGPTPVALSINPTAQVTPGANTPTAAWSSAVVRK